MEKILNWILKHKIITALLCVIAFAAPLVVVHIVFNIEPDNQWFAAKWGAGDVLSYVAGFEALLGTVILGAVTMRQSGRANEMNVRLSEENNYLQKISIQQMLPLLRVTALTVENANHVTYRYPQEKAGSLDISDVSTSKSRETHLNTYLPPVGSSDSGYRKMVKLTLENISGGAISQISVDRVEFSEFSYKGNHVDKASCVGRKESRCVNWLILPGDRVDISVYINFDDEIRKTYWEFDEFVAMGCFDMCLYLTNKSLSGTTYKEEIYIEKAVGFQEHVMYKAYEE